MPSCSNDRDANTARYAPGPSDCDGNNESVGRPIETTAEGDEVCPRTGLVGGSDGNCDWADRRVWMPGRDL
jgi:hypothetical protein